MAGGRPAKPTALKRLQGNPGHRALNPGEPQPDADSGYCPRHLSAMARAEWRRLAPALLKLGLLTVADRTAFEAYCESYAMARAARETLKKQGTTFATPQGYVQQRPEVSILNNALKQMHIWGAEFGIGPSSRGHLRMPSMDTADPFEEYLVQSRVTEALDE
jgi:P27 family predicted phage terminase small subunit